MDDVSYQTLIQKMFDIYAWPFRLSHISWLHIKFIFHLVSYILYQNWLAMSSKIHKIPDIVRIECNEMIHMVKISFNANIECVIKSVWTFRSPLKKYSNSMSRMCIQKCVNDVLVQMQSVAKMHNIQFMIARKCREKKQFASKILVAINYLIHYESPEIWNIHHVVAIPHMSLHIYVCFFLSRQYACLMENYSFPIKVYWIHSHNSATGKCPIVVNA